MLPADCQILATRHGGLLVSPSLATFCGLDHADVARVREALAGDVIADERLLGELHRHGFFAAPRPPPPPKRTVGLQLTNACNLRCGYCCTNSLLPRDEELGLDDWKRVVTEGRESFGPTVRFAVLGGEPLLVPFALDLVEWIAELDVHLALYTNGLALRDPEVASRVARLIKKGVEVRVSLAGATEETCDRQSGMPRYARVLAGLSELARHGATALVDLMFFPEDVDSIAANLPALRAALPAGSRLALGLAYHGGREVGDRVFGSRAELEAAFDRLVLEAGEEIAATATSPLTARRSGCACALGQSLNVRSDGELFSCFRMEEPVSNLRRTSFERTLAALESHPAERHEPCRSCALVSLCGGGCRTENLLFTGEADRPVCGPWRVEVISELLAEDHVSCLEWPAVQLASEARARGIDAPEIVRTVKLSRHMQDR